MLLTAALPRSILASPDKIDIGMFDVAMFDYRRRGRRRRIHFVARRARKARSRPRDRGEIAEQDLLRRIVIAQQFLQSRLAASHSPDRKKISRCLLTKLMTEVEIAYGQPDFPFCEKALAVRRAKFLATIAW